MTILKYPCILNMATIFYIKNQLLKIWDENSQIIWSKNTINDNLLFKYKINKDLQDYILTNLDTIAIWTYIIFYLMKILISSLLIFREYVNYIMRYFQLMAYLKNIPKYFYHKIIEIMLILKQIFKLLDL